jgi:nucleotide-binding universal stress UspA family protein
LHSLLHAGLSRRTASAIYHQLTATTHTANFRIADKQEVIFGRIVLLRPGCTDVPVRVAVGSVKEALLEAASESDADVLMIGRSHLSDSTLSNSTSVVVSRRSAH